MLVKFFANWCGHCRAMQKAYEMLAEHYKENDRVVIAEIEGDLNRELLVQHNIYGYPTLLLFKPGQKSGEEVSCARDYASMRSFIDGRLSSQTP